MTIISHHEGGTSINIPAGSGKRFAKMIGLVLLAMVIVAVGAYALRGQPSSSSIGNSAQSNGTAKAPSLESEAMEELKSSAAAEGVNLLHAEAVTETEFLVACENVPGVDPAAVRAKASDKTIYIKADIVNTIGQRLTPYYRMEKTADGWDIGAIVPPKPTN